jgi:pyruvate dehydrogenase E1 component alpha subunit
MHLVDLAHGFLGATPIVGATIPIGVGAAFGAVMKGESRVSVVFFGEGATEEGAFHESMNFASLKRLPVVFVCENNLFSVYSPMGVRQPPHREVFQQAVGHGVESHQADGNDVLTVHELAGHAVEKARRGEGPTFLEFKTYRWREHCGPNYDNDIGYRSEQDFLEWKVRCPLQRTREALLELDSNLALSFETWEAEIASELEEAIRFAKESPFPNPDRMMEHVYA